MIRQPIICVMGHVDHGKTAILDRIRNTTIASKEAGGITQHIGASEVPIDIIEKICGPMLKATNSKMVIPGLLFIDTPGHEAFTNLRRRGGSAADMAILVVDVSKGFEPQTIEAVEILKEYKTPFVVAANKADLITGWHDEHTNSIAESLKKQSDYVVNELNNRLFGIIGKMSELGFSSDDFRSVKDFQREIAIIPISAKTGEGIAELLMLVSGLSQKYLEMRLNIEVKGPGKGSILEKRELKGLGTTIDVILYEGSLRINDTIAFATASSIATAKIKALLKPKPLHEIRESSSKFFYVDSVSAACGVKISGNGLEDALPGSPLIQVTDSDYANEIKAEMSDVFGVDKTGIVLKADSIGSIEALSKLLKASSFCISKKGLGAVTKRDVLEAFSMKAVDPEGSVILAFNVPVESDAGETALACGIKIMKGNIIYRLIDDYREFLESMHRSTKESLEKELEFPGAIEILPNSCFRVSHPAIFGVSVEAGRIKPGSVLMNGEGAVIGKIKGIQNDKHAVEVAKKGENVAISMEGVTFGRQIREKQLLYTRVRDSDEKALVGCGLLDNEELALLSKLIEIKAKGRQQ